LCNRAALLDFSISANRIRGVTKKTSSKPEIKLFTIEEANRALPLVKAIVHDIVANYKAIRETMETLNERPENQELQDRVENLKDELMANVDELHRLGIELKSFEIGLVDFYHVKDEKLVYLCWKLGEETINWWHDLESGYSGRQPLIV
jgi:hypothetical protein